MIELKSQKEIEKMRAGGRITARILDELKKNSKAGVSTKKLEAVANALFTKYHAQASFKGFRGYPTSICTSVNEELVHGIPGKKILKNGDILGIDVGVYYKGFHTDAARTYAIGKINSEAEKLLKVTKLSLDKAIKAIKPGVRLGDIQALIQKTIEKAGFSVVRDLTGHGIGKNLQEEPSIANYGKRGTGLVLKEGMVLAIEPMVSAGNFEVRILADGWTVVSKDYSLTAHFEDTLAITQDGVKVLTRL